MESVRSSIRAAVRRQLVDLVERGKNLLSFLIDLVNDASIDLQTRLYAAEILLPYTSPWIGPLPAEPITVTAPGAAAQ